MHMDGIVHQQVFTDDSLNNFTIGVIGTQTYDNPVKFGTGAARFFSPEQGDYLTVPITDEWNMTGDWCVDFWMYGLSQNTSIARLLYRGGPEKAFDLRFDGPNRRILFSLSGIGGSLQGSTNSINYSEYTHITIVRKGTNHYMYINGNLEVSGNYGGTPDVTELDVGIACSYTSESPSAYYVGQIDELRIRNGAAIDDPVDPLYISSEDPADGFTPPATPYEGDPTP